MEQQLRSTHLQQVYTGTCSRQPGLVVSRVPNRKIRVQLLESSIPHKMIVISTAVCFILKIRTVMAADYSWSRTGAVSCARPG